MNAKKYLIAAGGTGGHINPALAVAGYIRQQEPQAEFLFVGTPDRMEARLIPAAGYAFETIEISGLSREKSLRALRHNAKVLLQLQRSGARAKKIIRNFAPDAVLGFGGYVSGPVLRTAARLGVPTAIHESNAFPGVANKALARLVDAVMITEEDARGHLRPKNPCILTGMPIRGELLAADRAVSRFELGISDKLPLVFSMGGSLGARPLNLAVTELLANKYAARDCAFIHSAGNEEACEVIRNALLAHGVDAEKEPLITLRTYVDDMARVLSAADIVICRAGASSLNEFQALGKASILVPAPHLAENHQYHNAMALVKRGAAVILAEKDLTGESLTQEVNALLRDSAKRREIGENAKKTAVLDASERIYEVIRQIQK